MKKFYDNYIKISDDKKISENVFKSRIILSAVAILSCFTVMISTALAFFNSNLTKKFTMSAAVWDVSVIETHTEGEIHEFTLSPRGCSATEGYCIIKITSPDGVVEEYCTDSFKGDKTVKIQAVAGCKFEFEPKWGRPDDYGYTEPRSWNIYHSSTPLTEEDEASGESSHETESGEISADTSTETSSGEDETFHDEPELSNGKTEQSDLSDAPEENTGDSPEEGSSSSYQQDSSSTDGSENSESDSSTEVSDAPVNSAGDSSLPSNDNSSSDGGLSSGGGESHSESSETASVDGSSIE